MSGPVEPPAVRRRRLRRPKTIRGWIAAGLAALLILTCLAVVSVRYGVLAPQGRLLIEARTDGLKLGRFGRLRIEGLGGDIWTHFTVRRATISDEKGVWLEARNLDVRWRYAQLLRRRLDVQAVTAQQVRLIRQPTLAPKGVDKGMPVSVQIDSAKARIEFLSGFSRVRGVYDLALNGLDLRRGGGAKLALEAASVLHPGDFLRIKLNLGRDKSLLVEADAMEARGGALAGGLGLLPDQPFALRARASGTRSLGRLSIVSHSGNATPIRAGGAWSPDGGAVNAYVNMTTSRHLRWWGKRLGDEAHLDIVGRKRKDGLFDLTAKAVATNVVLTAKGPADMGKARTSGLAVQVVLGDVNPFFSYPQMGGGTAVGSIAGGFTDFTIKADTIVRDISTSPNYRIARAYGPASIQLKDGEFLVHASLKSDGISGSGWEHAVAGTHPQGTFDLKRLRDGRVLFTAIDADGRGLKLKGTGEVGLFNKLNFHGDLKVFNLAQAHEGAGGSAHFQWTATQADVEAPWLFSYDGAAADFTSGYPEFDRILGRAPKVRGTATVLRNVVTVPKVEMIGAASNIQASGVQDADGGINYDGAWSAKGPFGIGPAEITGAARGKLKITQNWTTPKIDLTADIDTLDVPGMTVERGVAAVTFVRDANGVDFVGGFGLTGDSAYGPARMKSGLRFVEDGLDMTDIDADLGGVRARGGLSLRNDSPSSADLTVAVGPGAFLTGGQIGGTLKLVDQPGGAVAHIRLQTNGAVLRSSGLLLEKGSFTADGPLSRLPYRIDAGGGMNRNPLVLDGNGVISLVDQAWTISFNGGGQVRTTKFSTTEPIQVRFGPKESSARMRLALGGGAASIDARQTGETLSATAALQGVDVKFLSEDFVGRFDADLSLNGKGKVLNGALNARLNDARSRDAPASLGMNGELKAVLSDNRLAVDAAVASGQGLKSSANFVFATEATASPFRIAVARNAPMTGRFDVDGEVQPLWDLFLGGERTLGGRFVANAAVAGSINDPRITGRMSLQDGRFEDYATGLRLVDLDMQANLLGSLVQVSRFNARDAVKGTVSGSGRVSLERNGGSDFTLKLAGFRLIDNDIAVADASGDVTLTRGREGNVKIVGDLSIDNAEINAAARLAPNVASMDVVEVNRPITLQGQLAPVARRGPGAALDVRLSAPRRVFVRGRGLDVEMALGAHVTGTTALPELDGTARIVRGDYEFAGKTFRFEERGLVQLSTKPELIRLDLRAVREDPSLTAVVRILGTAAKPEITLTSTPVLPTDEVLSQVLFGRSASQLSPLEAAQLASALTGLAGGGGFDVIGNLRHFAGLDRLAFAGGGATGVSIAGGKYLTEDVYLEIGGGGRDGPSAQVEYRVNRALSVISRLTSEKGAKLAVRWRRDLGERRAGPARR